MDVRSVDVNGVIPTVWQLHGLKWKHNREEGWNCRHIHGFYTDFIADNGGRTSHCCWDGFNFHCQQQEISVYEYWQIPFTCQLIREISLKLGTSSDWQQHHHVSQPASCNLQSWLRDTTYYLLAWMLVTACEQNFFYVLLSTPYNLHKARQIHQHLIVTKLGKYTNIL